MTTVAQFSINYTQFLNAESEVLHTLPVFAEDTNTLINLYRKMVLLRTFDTKAIALQRTGKMGTYPSTLGQEAVSVAIGAAMHKDDVLCPFYREYGAQFEQGVKMAEILAYWGGDERGSAFTNCPDDFPICVPIGTQVLHAAGVATAFKIRQQKRVAVATCGDGATSQGDFYEAINLAGVWNLPVVFVINNNQWAISVPRTAQTHTLTLAQKAIAGGITGEQVDGNDVIAVHHVMEKALEKARNGGGATLVEAITYRLCDHTTADDASRYRGKEEVEKAWKEEPVLRLRNYLLKQNVWSQTDEDKLLAECAAQVDAAVQEYLKLDKPPVESMFDYHYATLPHDLVEQRIEATAMAKLSGDDHHG